MIKHLVKGQFCVGVGGHCPQTGSDPNVTRNTVAFKIRQNACLAEAPPVTLLGKLTMLPKTSSRLGKGPPPHTPPHPARDSHTFATLCLGSHHTKPSEYRSCPHPSLVQCVNRGQETRDQEILAEAKLCNNLRQVVCTYVPLSPSSVTGHEAMMLYGRPGGK